MFSVEPFPYPNLILSLDTNLGSFRSSDMSRSSPIIFEREILTLKSLSGCKVVRRHRRSIGWGRLARRRRWRFVHSISVSLFWMTAAIYLWQHCLYGGFLDVNRSC